jgi:hypothetical protein
MGGTTLDRARTCSGGRQELRDSCFSARTVFRQGGDGELYNYLPPGGGRPEGYCEIKPKSVCDADTGDSSKLFIPFHEFGLIVQSEKVHTESLLLNDYHNPTYQIEHSRFCLKWGTRTVLQWGVGHQYIRVTD